MRLNKPTLFILGAALLVGIVIVGVRKYQALVQENVLLKLKASADSMINDSTTARLATTVADKDSLAGLLKAAKDLNGKLIAGTKVHVPQKTVHEDHPALPTKGDSTRTAEFHDTTFAGTIDGLVTAPPCCAPLAIRYSLTQPEFNPSVGFVQVAGHMVAVVTWQGQHAQLDAPYAKDTKHTKPIGGFAQVVYAPIDKRVEGQAGLRMNTPWTQVVGGMDVHGQLFVGVRKDF